MLRPFPLVPAVVLLLLVASADVAAQATAGAWQIAPRVGAFLPMTSLGNVPFSSGVAGVDPDPRGAKLSAGVLMGVTFLRETRSASTRLRLDVDYAPPVTVNLEGASRGGPVQATGASVLVGAEHALDDASSRFRPHLSAVAGFRSYRFQPSLSHGPQFPHTQLSPAVRLGVGWVARVSVAMVGVELLDQLSAFRFADGARRIQNELQASFSVRVQLF